MNDDDSDVEIIDFKHGIEVQQQTIQTLQNELQIAITNKTELQSQMQLLREQNIILDKQRREAEETSLHVQRTLQRQLDFLTDQNGNHLKTQELLAQEIASHRYQINQLQEQLHIKEEELNLSEERVTLLQNQLSQAEAAIIEATAQRNQEVCIMQTELEALSRKQAEQSKEMARMSDKYEEEIQALNQKLTLEMRESKTLRESVKELNDELRIRVDTRRNVNEKLMNENMTNLSRIEQLTSQLEEYEIKYQKRTQERDHFKQQFVDTSGRIIAYQKDISEYQSQLNRIKGQLVQKSELLQRYEGFMESYRKMQSLAKEQVDECKQLKGQLRLQAAELEDQKRKNEVLTREVSNIKYSAYQSIQNMKAQLEQQTLQLDQQVSSTAISLQAKDKQIESLSNLVQTQKSEIQRLSTLYTQLQQYQKKMTLKKLQQQNEQINQIKTG